MKISALLISSLCILAVEPLAAQFSMIVSSAVAPQQTPDLHYIFVNRSSPRDEFTFDLSQVKASYFFGVGAKYDVNPFFFTAEALYNKQEYVYDVAYTFPAFGRTEEAIQYTEYMNTITMPVSLGVNLGVVEVTSGFLTHIIASQDTDLKAIRGYSQDLNLFRFGWQSGVAARIAQLRVGVSYQMDFNNYADHAYINNQNLSLQGSSTRYLATLGYHF